MNNALVQAFFAIFNFVLIAVILYRAAGPKVAQGLRERNEANRRAIEEAEAAQAKAAREIADYKSKLANVEAEFAAIREQARTMAAQTAQGIVSGAESDAERLRSHATAEIDRERRLAQQLIQQALLERALAAARAELQRQMSPEAQRQLVARFIQRVGEVHA